VFAASVGSTDVISLKVVAREGSDTPMRFFNRLAGTAAELSLAV